MTDLSMYTPEQQSRIADAIALGEARSLLAFSKPYLPETLRADVEDWFRRHPL